MENNNIGLIGCGAMGSALAKGIVQKVDIDPSSVYLYDINSERLEELVAELKTAGNGSLDELVTKCRVVFICVKPQDIESLLYSIRDKVQQGQIFASIAAGITINFIESCLPPESKIIRLMPNTPCILGEGTIAISTGDNVAPEERDQIIRILKSMGKTIRIPEYLMDAATGLSGTGPAYVFLFIETMIDAGVAVGFRRDVASEMVIQNIIGSARMLQENNRQHPAELRNSVTSPAGTTTAAMHVLEESGFRSCLLKSVIAATNQAEKLRRG